MKKDKNLFKDFDTVIKYTKVFCWCMIVVLFVECLIMLITSTLVSLEINNIPFEEISSNNNIIEYISEVNSTGYSETIEILNVYDDKFEIILFEIILPVVLSLIPFIFLITFFVHILNLLRDVKDKKSLFTNKKLMRLRELNIIFEISFVLFLFNYFNSLLLVIFVILEFAYTAILYLFNYCVNFENK